MRPNRFAVLIALLVLAASSASARPLRTGSVAAPSDVTASRGATPARLLPGSTDAFCGTSPIGLSELVRGNTAHPEIDPLPTPNSTDVGDVAVLEDDGNFFYTHNTGNPKVDLMAVSRAFYRTHGDDYDFLAVFLASGLTDWLGSPTSFAASYVVRNPTQGLGLPIFDEGAQFGSPSRLEDILSMNGLHKYKDDPDAYIPEVGLSGVRVLGHEAGHRWLSYVGVDSLGSISPALLGRAYQHWGFFFDSDASVMEGCDWAVAPGDSFTTVEASTTYGRLDQYLMGLRSAFEIDSLLKIDDPYGMNPPGNYEPTSIPDIGIGGHGRATWWKMANVISANGPRVPDATSAPHAFRTAVILAIPRGTTATAADLQRVDAIRARFPSWFASETEGRGAMDVTLIKHAGRVVIEHMPVRDREDTFAPVAFGARVTIEQAGIPLAVDPASVQLLWRPTSLGPFNVVPMTPAGPDSFAASLPGAPGDFEYYLKASSDSAGIDATDPPAGASAPHAFRLGPDLTPPAVVHLPVRQQAPFRMPQTLLARATDGVGVDSVWFEYHVNGGPLQTLPTAPAGRDSFTVGIGGFPLGTRVVYRFVARDQATAGNLGFSRANFDTMEIVDTGVEDFENGEGGFLHLPWTWSYRDPWHSAIDPTAPERGTGMFAGENTGTYGPHLDAVLVSPFFSGLPPGTFLRFDHRYDIEQESAAFAWDAIFVEAQNNNGPWVQIAPVDGYTHELLDKVSVIPAGTPCWSGISGGWKTETFDLSSLLPGPIRVRFRMLSDEFIGREGWRIDHLRIQPPNSSTGVGDEVVTAGRLWPNPARDRVRLSLPRTFSGEAEWALHDLAGRKVATLWRGVLTPGASLAGTLPADLKPGLYFARLRIAGREADVRRVTVIR